MNTKQHILRCEELFDSYFELIVKYNKKYNLTTIVDRPDVFKKHFEDSLLGMDLLPINCSVVDIGCGAGLPSLPLCIVRSDLQASLYDSVQKKVNFCNIAIKDLGLADRVKAIHSRVEDIGKRESFDICVARAVAKLNTLAEYALPLLKVGGCLLAYKSSDIEQELELVQKILPQLGGQLQQVKLMQLDQDTLRKIVVIKKLSATNAKYPRGKNLPRTNPLS